MINKIESVQRGILVSLFIVSLLTGINILFGGAEAVPGVNAHVEASVDSELRFFSVFWLAYGVFCLWVTRNMKLRQHFIPAIAAIFFLGGIARMISALLAGMPSAVLIPAMILELVLPILMYGLYKKQTTSLKLHNNA